MQVKVVKKQKNDTLCFACGVNNPSGLKTYYYELENGELASTFFTREDHQSYPGRLHGGVAAAVLDESIGRAIMIEEPQIWGVTMELSLKYRKPVPLGERLTVVSRITKNTRRVFEGTGEILLQNGEVAVSAQGRYLKMSIEKITDGDGSLRANMQLYPDKDDPAYFDLPNKEEK